MRYWVRLTDGGDVILASFTGFPNRKIPRNGDWVDVTPCILSSPSVSVLSNDNLYHKGYKYYIKVTPSHIPILGSLIATKVVPKGGHWKEITACLFYNTSPSGRAHSSGFSNGYS